MKFLAKLFEYGGQTQLSSMRAMMAESIRLSSKARRNWKESPWRAAGDSTGEGRGQHSLDRMKKYAAEGYTPVLDEERRFAALASD